MWHSTYLTVISTLVASYTAYYLLIIVQKPKIRTGSQKLRKFLENHVPVSQSTYWPSIFVWHGILQSMFAITRRYPSSFKIPYEREIVKLRDGGQVGLDFLPSAQPNEKKTLRVLFLPGLTSSSQTSYVKSLVLAVAKAGANVHVMNYRGIGGVPLSTPKSYNASTTSDLVDMLDYLKKKYPGEKFLVIGTSFGGIILNRYLTKEPQGAKDIILGGFIISSPFDLENGQRGIESPLTKYLLNYPVCADMKKRMQSYDSILKGQPWYSVEKIQKCRTVRDFDRYIASQMDGFNSEKDYYEECSSIGKFHLLPVPLFAFNATDDPIQYGQYLPFKEAEAEGSKLALITTTRGGHLGFLEGLSPIKMEPFHFMEKLVGSFVQAVLHNREEFATF